MKILILKLYPSNKKYAIISMHIKEIKNKFINSILKNTEFYKICKKYHKKFLLTIKLYQQA